MWSDLSRSTQRRSIASGENLMTSLDLNSDLGERDTAEGRAIDADMMGLITSVNIACGGHAGTPALMRRTARLAAEHGLAIGAHPGFPDRAHFGRTEQTASAQEITALVVEQVAALADIIGKDGLVVRHVKPHGALYNMAGKDRDVAQAVVAAVRAINPSLLLYALAGSVLAQAAQAAGLGVVHEAFADRAYRADGTLVPRSEQGAVLHGEADVRRQLRRLLTGSVASVEGPAVPVQIHSLCVHADTPQAVSLARMIRSELASAGIRIAAPQP
jgi:5-oxoprolinase (ATP-hydrolysing) subunit A